MSERWQFLRGDAESSDHLPDTDSSVRSMQPGKPAVAVITASGEIFGGKLHGSLYVRNVRWPGAGSWMGCGLCARLYECSRLLRSSPPFVSRVLLSHSLLAPYLCPSTCIAAC